MRDMIETVSILISVGIVIGPVWGFVWYMRRMARKEKEVLRQYGYKNSLEEVEV